MAKILKAENIQTEILGNNGNNAFNIQRNNSSLITLSTSNYIGIGTTSPSSKLTVNGSSEVDFKMESSAKLATEGTRITFSLTNASNSLYEAAGIRAKNTYSNMTAGSESSYLTFYTKNNGTLYEGLVIDKDGTVTVRNQLIARGNPSSDTTNTALGLGAGANMNASISSCTAIGYNSMNNPPGPGYYIAGNVGVGDWTLRYSYGSNNTAIGSSSLSANSAGSDNTTVGFETLRNNSTGAGNVAVGKQSLYNNTIGYSNVAIGSGTAILTTTGNKNISIGSLSLGTNVGGSSNIAIGDNALYANKVSSNIGVGDSALYSNTTGTGNIAVGYEALRANTIGFGNTAIGYRALRYYDTSNHNIAIGHLAMSSGNGISVSNNVAIGSHVLANCQNSFNVGVGYNALARVDFGYRNVAVGTSALGSVTNGSENTAVGDNALASLSGSASINTAIGTYALAFSRSSYNTACGHSSLYSNTLGSNNAAFGWKALYANTTGSYNTAIGDQAMDSNTTGVQNTAIGYHTLDSNTIGYNNTAVGYTAAAFCMSGANNVSIGNTAGFSNVSGQNNVCVGVYAGGDTLVSNNVAIGNGALSTNSTGPCNVAVGHNALNNTISGNNVAIGFQAGANSFGANNIFIGTNSTYATQYASNAITLGNSSHTVLRCNVTSITALSDLRDKKNIENLPVGLDFINDLRPVKFIWNQRDSGRVGLDDVGFIAQESLETVNKYNANWMGLVDNQNPEKLEMSYGKLVPVLVKAIQQLKHDFDLYVSGQALKT